MSAAVVGLVALTGLKWALLFAVWRHNIVIQCKLCERTG
jgi:4-amino-4-deoxy-L-arabinose transferase-like glycosyltransferase